MTARKYIFFGWLVAVTLWWGADTAAATPAVLVVMSRLEAPYALTVQGIRAKLAARSDAIELTVQSATEFSAFAARTRPPALIVTVGVEAARRVAQTNPPAPILHTLLPRSTALDILQNGRNGKPAAFRDSAIFLDQPIGRQLSLIRLALPHHKRVAVLLGPSTQSQLPELRTAAREHGLVLNTAVLTRRDELLPMLEDMLEDNDVLLSVADPLIYHSETIHHLLLTTYRYKIPVVGLAKTYVDAGALLAVYSTPEQIGQEVAHLLATLPATGEVTLPAPAYPKRFLISINRSVAASLDLGLDNESTLQRKLEALQRP